MFSDKKNQVGNNLTWHQSQIIREQRQKLNGHSSCTIWFTGLSGSGKSTLANRLDTELYAMKVRSYVLDGDNLRHGLNRDLGFSPDNRQENIRRVGETAKLFVDAGLFAITAFISPYRQDRDVVRKIMEASDFIEIYLDCSIGVCRQRDPKGLYKKADAGIISEFTGVSSPYEAPLNPDITIKTDILSEADAVEIIISYLSTRKLIYP